MTNFVLTCCSTADMPKEYFESRNIPYVCYHYMIDGKEYADDLGVTISFNDFYQKITDGAMPTTSQVTLGQFIEFFEPYLMNGKDVLHLSLSSGISGSYNSACLAAETLKEKYPERKVKIVDSLAASSGYGLLVDMAADLRDKGSSLEDLSKWLEDNRLTIHHWFFSTDLTHFKRGGRVSASAALVGNILSICPLLNVSNEGKLISRTNIRGKKKVTEAMVRKMREHALNGLAYSGKCFISNSACYEDARRVADLVEQSFPDLAEPVMINSIGTVIGSHTGPGTVALFFVGDKRVD